MLARDRLQAGLLFLCGAAAALVAIAFWMAFNTFGDLGVAWEPASAPFVERIVNVMPGSPGDHAGLRAGDTLDTRLLTPEQRLRFYAGQRLGVAVTLPIERNGAVRAVTVMPWSETHSAFWRADGWDQELSIVGELWQIAVAALLLWRRPRDSEVRILALILVLPQLGVAIAPQLNNWVSPWPTLDLVLYTISTPIIAVGTALLATYAWQFGRPISALRRIFTSLAYGLAAMYGIGGAIVAVGSYMGTIDLPRSLLNQPVSATLFAIGNTLLPLVCALLALRTTAEKERARLSWVVGSFSVNYIAAIIFTITQTTGLFVHQGALVVDISVLITPLGLTYAILSRKVLDLGFVFNRAAVYTAVSLLIVGTFSLVEWALGGWLQTANKSTNLIVAAALALILGLSIHPLHRWVDRFVDRIFFQKRHEDEAALRRFAHEAAYTSDTQLVIERAIGEVSAHTDCLACEILIQDDAGRYGGIDGNDRALVALRARGTPVDLHTIETALHGERAYPMLARGRLLGVLVIGPKRSGELYAPDESAAIAELAHGVGVAIDLLGASADATASRLLAAVESLERCVERMQHITVERPPDSVTP